MAFTQKLPEWNATGVEPSSVQKQTGFQPGMKPPAQWFNWHLNWSYLALKELQEKAAEKSYVDTEFETIKNDITQLQEDVQNADIPDASLTEKGKTQLSSATDSELEDRASTPKAVKAAYDRGSEGVTAAQTAQTIINNRDGYGTTTNSGNAYAVTLSPAPGAYVDGLRITIKINATNTGAVTININGLGAKSVLKSNGTAMTANSLRANSVYSLVYNGTAFILQGEGGEYGTAVAGDVRAGKSIGTDAGLVTGTLAERATTSITPSNAVQNFPAGIYPAFAVQAAPVPSMKVSSGFESISVPVSSTVAIPRVPGTKVSTEILISNYSRIVTYSSVAVDVENDWTVAGQGDATDFIFTATNRGTNSRSFTTSRRAGF
ncbi:phage tail protein [Paenibacillus tundrae]|uniref:Tail fiber protein n=1 Tax=Paenibacillus tundrae TaxID=528187 RepID=A0ABT9W7G5_9BACL|nr:phage tail protein [Paenibacillus tundrae]MDQ0169192.1 hypothetical protein [Paenibacillus tundrae]